MANRIAFFSLLVPDYDDALAFFLRIGFTCREDTDLGHGKRWVRIAPAGGDTEILLARAVGERQINAIGDQGGGRVWLFLETTNFETDYRQMLAAGIQFEEPPRVEAYGRVAVWSDPWGNRWDLIEFARPDRSGTDSRLP
ncbi:MULTISPECIES: VOC family protein [unclassified Yoonia]|uniref:VOC family protein n=1 Tax=unclassified Yoonia TaxID=2629118 RepID=UPI002B002496|nr:MULTISPECIES: VOC family protein [unclassified Yoonia]